MCRVVPYPEDDTVGLIEKLGSTETLLMVRTGRTPRAARAGRPLTIGSRASSDETRRLFLRENGMNLVAGTQGLSGSRGWLPARATDGFGQREGPR